MNPSQVFSLFVVLSLMVGMSLRKKQTIHKWWMILTVLADVSLVVYLTLARNAVGKAVERTVGESQFSSILMIHISFALLSIIGYVIGITLGFKIASGKRHLLVFHRYNARIMLVFRILTFITAFFIPISK